MPTNRLTPRQEQVAHLIADGCTNVEVAERLAISPRTAKAHADALRERLGVSRRRHIPAALRALAAGGQAAAGVPGLDAGTVPGT